MAKDKEKDKQVYKVEDKYHCAECHAEVPVKQSCPSCKKEIDWDRVIREIGH